MSSHEAAAWGVRSAEPYFREADCTRLPVGDVRRTRHSHLAVGGKPDLVARQGTSIIVFEVKTGARKPFHETQALLYTQLLPRAIPALARCTFSAVLLYRDARLNVADDPSLPGRLDRVLDVLEAEEYPETNPSFGECRQCNIARSVCAERID